MRLKSYFLPIYFDRGGWLYTTGIVYPPNIVIRTITDKNQTNCEGRIENRGSY